jgi:hypothetical protein
MPRTRCINNFETVNLFPDLTALLFILTLPF